MFIEIDVLLDFVFKLLFGRPENVDLLLDFVTAVVKPEHPIVELHHVNPATSARSRSDDVTVVDVAARDAEGNSYAIEVQLQVRPSIRERILYHATDLFQEQLSRGSSFRGLRRSVSIWVLGERMSREERWHRAYRLRDEEGRDLSPLLEVHVLELPRWAPADGPLDNLDQWAYFFREGGRWQDLPAACGNPALRKAMGVLDDIRIHEEKRARYLERRMELERNTLAIERAEEKAAVAQALRDAEAVRAAAEAQLAEAEIQVAEAEAQRAEAEAQRAEAEAQRAELEAQRDAAQQALVAQAAELAALRAALRDRG